MLLLYQHFGSCTLSQPKIAQVKEGKQKVEQNLFSTLRSPGFGLFQIERGDSFSLGAL